MNDLAELMEAKVSLKDVKFEIIPPNTLLGPVIDSSLLMMQPGLFIHYAVFSDKKVDATEPLVVVTHVRGGFFFFFFQC